MRRNGEMKLGVMILPMGVHYGAWRDPSVPANGGVDIDQHARLAALAEGAAFHFLFLPDIPSVGERDHALVVREQGSKGLSRSLFQDSDML
ncbi:hypothetical protein [Bradyrhizobium zhanjiangense]|uniref:hypothetical protein n=1 Tax=Bradyrhizobium zhanjiangense TaxID=1325107 RepID=UPI0010089116|nr:hypothetical protein [Bradyrhizobium zhanjiangense]